MSDSVIRDVVFRTSGEMYIGVVGPVRSGKSMFIRKFIENKVMPYVVDEDTKNKILDDLPQSAEGKTIMTVEPKFVPSNNVYITVENELNLSVRLVDCVGYIIPSSKGYVNEDGAPRTVKTPWFSDDIPFEEAATIGTKKVIENHSHIGILLTSDGSFGEFSRNDYEEIEKKLVDDLKNCNKPFVIVLNTKLPQATETLKLVEKMAEAYDVLVVPADVSELSDSDIDTILKAALNEFDISKLDIKVPSWISSLNDDNEIKSKFNEIIDNVTGEFRKFKHVDMIRSKLSECELFESVIITSLDSGTGEVEIEINCEEELYNQILADIVGEAINDKGAFIALLQDAMNAKYEYDSLKGALESVKATGYGISTPKIEDMTLDTPEIIKQGSRYGVKLRALAPSIHLIKVDVESTFEPIIGSEEQSKILLDKIMSDYENDPTGIWDLEIFGRKLSEVVNDGIKAKLYMLPDNVQYKIKESLEKIVNKGKGGILAFIL